MNLLEIKNFKKWSEGNKELFKLFVALNKLNIKTLTSCGGHNNRMAIPCLAIEIDNNSLPYFKRIIAEIRDIDDIWIAYHYNLPILLENKSIKDITKSFHIYGTNSNCYELFYRTRKSLTNTKAVVLNEQEKYFLNELKKNYLLSDIQLYNKIINNDGCISNHIGDKERIVNEVNSGKHKKLLKRFI